MKTKYLVLACAALAAAVVGIGHAKSNDDERRQAGASAKTVELIFKTPSNGVILKGDPSRSEETHIATVDTSSYRRIRVMARSVNNEITDALLGVYEGELDNTHGVFHGFYGTHIVDVPGTVTIVRGAVSPEYENIPIRVVIYGER
jgi:hypothetical protein